MRAWVQFDETALAPAFYRLMLEQDPAQQAKKRAVYEDRLKVLEDHLRAEPSPFLLGSQPTLADVTLYTHLTRLPVLHRARGVAQRDSHEPLSRWLDAMGALRSVSDAAPSTTDLEFDLKPYLEASVQGMTAMDMAGRYQPK